MHLHGVSTSTTVTEGLCVTNCVSFMTFKIFVSIQIRNTSIITVGADGHDPVFPSTISARSHIQYLYVSSGIAVQDLSRGRGIKKSACLPSMRICGTCGRPAPRTASHPQVNSWSRSSYRRSDFGALIARRLCSSYLAG